SVSGEPCVRTAPEPFRVTPVQTTDLLCPDLDLSVTLTPERPADRRRRQHLYRALVSVSLSHEQLISQALRDRPTLATPTSSQTAKLSSQPLEAPGLQPFYNPDKLLRETPLLPGDHIPLPRPRPAPRPAQTTFHLHHRYKLWES
ncbi:protein phosphatase 1 regulatory subunit 35, partial [Triplophysa rosa]